MTLIKKNSSDAVVWTNPNAYNDFMANPANGGGTGSELTLANMDFTGCEMTPKTTDALGNTVQVVKCIPGNMDLTGCSISISGFGSRTIPNAPGNMDFIGTEQTPGHTIQCTPGNMDFTGVTQSPGHRVFNSPGNMDFKGLYIPPLIGLNTKIPLSPGNMDFKGSILTPYNYATGYFSTIITNTPGSIDFTGCDLIPAHGVTNAPGSIGFTGCDLIPAHGVINVPGNIDFKGIEQRVMFVVPDSIQKKKFYLCKLTGSSDGKEDVYLRISNISIRIRNGEPTYCGVTVPAVSQNEDYINDRPNGQIVIYRGYEYTDGTQNVAEIVRVDLEDVASDQGSKSSSFRLSGHATESYHYPVTIDVRPIQAFSLQANGARRIRSQTDFFLRPGDRLVYGESGEYFTAGMISITVGKNLDRMEVTEEAA